MTEKNFILASGSVPRRQLLEQIGYTPKLVDPADIDETTGKYETPTAYVKRMAVEKASAVAARHPGETILACDTVVVSGNKVIHKSRTPAKRTVSSVRFASSAPTGVALCAVCRPEY